MKNIVNFVLARLEEKSTYVGIFSFLAAFTPAFAPKFHLTADQQTAIMTAGMGIAGFVLMIVKESK